MPTSLRDRPSLSGIGLSAMPGTSQLGSGAHALQGHLERKAFTNEQELQRAIAFGNVARGYAAASDAIARGRYVNEIDYRDQAPAYVKAPSAIAGYVSDPTPPDAEPFIVITMTYQGQRYTYSDVDRPVGRGVDQAQLDGRVISVGYIARRLAPDGGIARLNTSIQLANHDEAMNAFFRSPDFLAATFDIRVGFRAIPPAWYRRVGPPWRVDRVTAITPRYVELSLVDATDERFGMMVTPPSRKAVQDAHFEIANADVHGANDPHLPVPFGTELVRAYLCGEGTFNSGASGSHEYDDVFATAAERQAAFGPGQELTRQWYVLGAAPSSAAIGHSDIYAIKDNPGGFNFRVMVMTDPDHDRILEEWVGPSTTKIDDRYRKHLWGRIFSRPVDFVDPLTKVTRTWYVAFLMIETNRWSQAWKGFDKPIVKWPQTYRDAIKKAEQEGRLWVMWPSGVTGSVYTDAATIIRDLVARFMTRNGTKYLHKESFDAVFDKLRGTTSVAGTYEPEAEGTVTMSDVARSHGLDLFWGADDKLHIAGPWPDRLSGITAAAGAPVYDGQWDIVKDSWQETIPLGNERHGLANRLKIDGLKDYTRVGFVEDLGLDLVSGGITSQSLIELWGGRVLEATVSWLWRRSAYIKTGWNAVLDTPRARDVERSEPHAVATFYVPLHGLELELGDFIRVSYHGGSQADGGYDFRLMRVEEVGLDWSGKRVKLVAVDADEWETGTFAVFDKEDRWSRLLRRAPDGVLSISITSGNTTVTLNGQAFRQVGIKVGNFIVIDQVVAGAVTQLECLRITSIASLAGSGQVTVDIAPTHTGTYGVFNVQRDHEDPPTEADFPGRYPFGSDMFFRACDEANGVFTGGGPGYTAQREE